MSDFMESVEKLIDENRENLENLEKWILTQPFIPKNHPRPVLIRFLKFCNFDLEKAKKLLDINAKFRISHQYLFTDRDTNSEDFRRIISTVQYTGFPKLSKEGYAIESFRIIKPDLENFNIKDVIKLVIMTHDMNALIGPNINGAIIIYDAKGFTFKYFVKFVSNIRAVIHYAQYGLGFTCVHNRQVHIVNCSPIISRVISMLKPFLTREIIENMHCHPSGFESLHKFIDKECLPVEYGGSAGTLDEFMQNTLDNLQNNRDFIRTNENFFLLNTI